MKKVEYTWKALIEGAKKNDQKAFYALYQNSYDAVYRTVKSMVRDDDAALDIVQDTFVKAFSGISTLENPDNFLPWIKRIATNKAKDWFKKKREISFSQMSDDEDYVPDFEDDRVEHIPDAVIDRNETTRLIDEILSTLSDEQRIAVGMYYYQDMSVAEIARELEVSENTVKSRLNYGRQKIKAGVEDLERRGTKLYTLAPLPFFIWLLKCMQAQAGAWNAPAAAFGKIMADAAHLSAATVASGSSSSAGGSASAGPTASGSPSSAGGSASTGSAVSGSAPSTAVPSYGNASVKPTVLRTAPSAAPSTSSPAPTGAALRTAPPAVQPSSGYTPTGVPVRTVPSTATSSGYASAGTAVAQTGAAAAGKTAGGLFASLGAKIVAGVLATAILAGGVGTGVYYAVKSIENPGIEETVGEVSEDLPFEDETAAGFEELEGVYKIDQYRGVVYLAISSSGDYQLYNYYGNGAIEDPYQYWETGKFGELKQKDDGSYDAKVLESVRLGVEKEDYFTKEWETFFAVNSLLHIYPSGISAEILDENVWIGLDNTFSEEEYYYNLEFDNIVNENGNFNKNVIWMEGVEAAFVSTDLYYSDISLFEAPVFFDWDMLNNLNSKPPTDGDRIVFSGVIGEYNYDEIVSLQNNIDPNEPWSDKSKTYFVIVLDTPQTLQLHSGVGEDFRSDEVRLISIPSGIGLEQYSGKHLFFSIDPNVTYWPTDTSLPLGQPHTSDINVLG